ncbi:MAG TPA: LLM class flavin-dependent oxidoreductase [Nitrososphaeraceae archaeon]|nr:LLM class flavin-dependent oxidoreductase [Nitrososphaeraceae archaeon]
MKQPIFGVHLPVMGLNSGSGSNKRDRGKEKPHTREQMLSIARKAESLGYDSLSVNDHIVFRTSWLDSLSTLSAVAAVTNKIKLGTSILNIVVRNPVICAKSLSAIDILSSGRLFAAGVGPGSHKGDYDVCGIPFEQRWSRFNEALEILHMVWNDRDREEEDNNDTKSPSPTYIGYNGKYFQLEKISIEPKPFQKPHPPIFIGTWGSSEAGLRRAAKYGDGWMASAYNITPDKFKEKWNTLLSYRKRLGKDSESFENSVVSMFGYIDNDKDKVHTLVKDILSLALGRPVEQLENLLLFGSIEECIRKINALCEAGVKRIHFWPISDFEEQIEIFRKEIVAEI